MKTIQELKLYIADDRIEDVLDELLTHDDALDNSLFNQIVLIKSQYKDFSKRENLNMNESSIEKQKIVNGLLNILDEVENRIKESEKHKSTPEKEHITEGVLVKGPTEIISALWANLYGYQTKNVDIVMMTMHPKSPIIEGFRDYVKQIFAHNIIYKILSLELDSQIDDEASVKMVLESKTLDYDDTFKNNISTSMQLLKRDTDGSWKLWTGEILELKYLET
jgi:hypothetical protein